MKTHDLMMLKMSMTAFGIVMSCQPTACMPIEVHLVATPGGQGSAPKSNHTMRCRPFTRTHGYHTLGVPIAPSEWERLDDDELDVYFQADEANGIRNRSCGPERTSNGTIRWISGMATTVPGYELLPRSMRKQSYTSGPCCPNGHTYGWFGKEHNDTEALRRVQVVNGVRTRPFQIRRLLSCLRLSCDQFEVAPRQRFVIMLIGDSTVVQLFWALFCALNRIGGVVHECIQEPKSHYEHPSCERRTLEWTKTTGLQIMASVQVGGTLYVLKHVHEKMIGDAEHQSRVLGACSSDSSGGHVDCPDFVIINTGLHVRWRSGSIGAAEMRNYLRGVFALPEPVLSRAVWRETIVQHFPSDDGLYEHRNQSDEASRMAPTCKLRINISDHSTLYRQHYAHSLMVEIAREQGVHPLPYVSIDGVEANSGHLFPLSTRFNLRSNNTDLDCTHRVYTPLYYDAIFAAFADTLCGYI